MPLSAFWIWHPQPDYCAYHRTIVARRSFRLPRTPLVTASMAVTADSWYRLRVNGTWVNDGPARSWPAHYSYDVLDLRAYLAPGVNTLEITACYFGCGSYHQDCRQAGLLAQLDLTFAGGRTLRVVSDGAWQTAAARAWVPDTPKIAQQMEPQEYYDARHDALRFANAAVLFPARRGPWKDLTPRDSALLTRVPVSFARFLHAKLVRKDWCAWTFPVARLLYPGVVEMNASVSLPACVVTIVHSTRARTVPIESYLPSISANGALAMNRAVRLRKGPNVLVACMCHNGPGKDQGLRFAEPDGLSFENPLDPRHDNPWAFVPFEEFLHQGHDLTYNTWFPTPEWSALLANIDATYQRVCTTVRDAASFKRELGARARLVPRDEMCLHDPAWQFEGRRVCGDAAACVEQPAALMHDNAAVTTIRPDARGDVELLYDLGAQNIGYYAFELGAAAGAIIDITGVEYIAPNGRVQHTIGCKNLLRHVCKEGINRFLSVKRRAGRFVFITLRNQTAPVRIRLVHLVESTYPVNTIATFNCSDDALVRVWDISSRTLKLCMEDSFTDCPLYEQTLWVGDARNEALYAATVFGAHDLIRRCLLLAGQSLEYYPLVSAQVPSAWDMLLPAWSFLWGIGIWDYYFATGDRAFLKQIWPAVMQNLRNAAGMRDARGLFSGPFWNMFDWAAVDDRHCTVLHNSLLLVGAVRAARWCADVVRDARAAAWLDTLAHELTTALNALWNPATNTYPDSVHDNTMLSDKTCQHTSFLALLYDVIPPEHAAAALANCLAPPATMTRVGSPFAIQYLYEALEKVDRDDVILDSLADNFLPMLQAGATTVWEQFPTGVLGTADFPTRSHCHAWSAAPLYFLNRIVLGIRPITPGGAAYQISPHVARMTWAEGGSAGARGPVYVRWEKSDGVLRITASAPKGVRLAYQPNPTHHGLQVAFAQVPPDHFFR